MPELVFTWRTYPWNDRDRRLRVHQERVKLTPLALYKLYMAWSRASLGGDTQVVELPGDIEVQFTPVGRTPVGQDEPWNLNGCICTAACMSMATPSRTLKRHKWERVRDLFFAIKPMDVMRLQFAITEGLVTREGAWVGEGVAYDVIE